MRFLSVLCRHLCRRSGGVAVALLSLLLLAPSLRAAESQQPFPFPLGIGGGNPGIPGLDLLCSLGPVGSFDRGADAIAEEPQMEVFNLARRALISECFPDPNCGNAVLMSNETVETLMISVGATELTEIRYSPEFMNRLSADFGPEAMFGLFAHEWGHEFDRRVPAAWMDGSWSRELRADAWAGCALASSGQQPATLRLMLLVLSTYPSLEHPGFAQRAPAFQAGYSQCGGLGQLPFP